MFQISDSVVIGRKSNKSKVGEATIKILDWKLDEEEETAKCMRKEPFNKYPESQLSISYLSRTNLTNPCLDTQDFRRSFVGFLCIDPAWPARIWSTGPYLWKLVRKFTVKMASKLNPGPVMGKTWSAPYFLFMKKILWSFCIEPYFYEQKELKESLCISGDKGSYRGETFHILQRIAIERRSAACILGTFVKGIELMIFIYCNFCFWKDRFLLASSLSAVCVFPFIKIKENISGDIWLSSFPHKMFVVCLAWN